MYNDIQENLHLQTASLLRSARPAGKCCALYRTYGSNESRGIANMAKLDLTKYGITGTTEIVYNPSYEQLFEEETKPGLEGYEKGQVSELGAVNVMTGIYTGRSPKDKFIVMDENSKDTVWWTSDEYKNDNHPASQEAVQQAPVRGGCILRCQQGYPHGHPLCHGSCMAGTLCHQHVHQAHR